MEQVMAGGAGVVIGPIKPNTSDSDQVRCVVQWDWGGVLKVKKKKNRPL